MIIMYRKMKRKQKKNKIRRVWEVVTSDQLSINRQIYKGRFKVNMRSMTEQSEWWKGLGEELELTSKPLTNQALNNFQNILKNFTR